MVQKNYEITKLTQKHLPTPKVPSIFTKILRVYYGMSSARVSESIKNCSLSFSLARSISRLVWKVDRRINNYRMSGWTMRRKARDLASDGRLHWRDQILLSQTVERLCARIFHHQKNTNLSESSFSSTLLPGVWAGERLRLFGMCLQILG